MTTSIDTLEPSLHDYLDRQLGLGRIWREWDQNFLNRSFLVLGCGGNGSHVSLALTCMGAKNIIIVDKDFVEASNITRQVLYTPSSVGKRKVDEAKKSLDAHSFNSEINGRNLDILANREETERLVKSSDFVFALTDSVPSKVLTSWLCLRYRKPMITGGTDALSGHISNVQFQRPDGRPCFECMDSFCKMAPREWVEYYCSPSPMEKSATVSEYDEKVRFAGKTLSVYYTASIGSCFKVWQAVRYLLGWPVPSRQLIELRELRIYNFDVPPNDECVLCGKSRPSPKSS